MEQKLEAIFLKNVSSWLKFRNILEPKPISVLCDRVFYPQDAEMRSAIYDSAQEGILIPANYKNHGKP